MGLGKRRTRQADRCGHKRAHCCPAGYAARTLLYNMALSISHKAAFSILKNIRQKILEKLPKLPLGTVMDMSSGKMKQIIVNQVDGMETTLAHRFPELTANIAGPLFIVVCLFVLDWRMALLSIVTLPVGMAFMMSVMGSYAKNYEGVDRYLLTERGVQVAGECEEMCG